MSRQISLFGDEPEKPERDAGAIKAPFPYFGGKSGMASLVWYAFGEVKQYIEPFCGSAAMLLGNPAPASLEVIGDVNCYIANFWRAVKYHPEALAAAADYPVSHLDLAARHRWLVEPERVAELAGKLADPEWPGDAQIAGWWCWGQCAWIGSGWCDSSRGGAARKSRTSATPGGESSQVPFGGHKGIHRGGSFDGADLVEWMRELSDRLKRVRVIHGSWDRCLNMHYGDKGAAVFFDPPYLAYERLYGKQEPVAAAVATWCAERPEVRIALCGHLGDYELPGWQVINWDRGRLTYGGGKTTTSEAIWFSPACRSVK